MDLYKGKLIDDMTRDELVSALKQVMRLDSIRERCKHMQAQLRQDGLSSYGDGFVSACDMVLSILGGVVERQENKS